LRSIATQRSPYKVRKTDFLSREIENDLVKLFRLEFELIQEIYAKLETLKYIFGFEIRKSFEFMDKFNLNYLDERNLAEFISDSFKFISINDARMLLKRFDIDNDGKVGFKDYLFLMQLGKHNKLYNFQLNRLNFTLPNLSDRLNLDKNSHFSSNNKGFNYDYNVDNNKILDNNYIKKNISNANNNFIGYGDLSYRQGEDPDIDTLRFNISGNNIIQGRKNCHMDNFNLSGDQNIFKTSLISDNPGNSIEYILIFIKF